MPPAVLKWTCITDLPSPSRQFDTAQLDRLHSLVVGVVTLIGVAVLVGLVVCLACTRGSRHHPNVGSPVKRNEDDARISRDTQNTTSESQTNLTIGSYRNDVTKCDT